ncbi:MAG: diacylglycerol kinase family protein [Peptoniphilaceae bacterium]|nr:hypothetical protein [Peptoniphilaceae bacterium]MDD7383915.1 diacylglycerol kinase family protein [Peptoniphilaceae bacterium]MDY3738058.1 diacylglycerol kinase family protein [Peptoniphilaceae bacterium]
MKKLYLVSTKSSNFNENFLEVLKKYADGEIILTKNENSIYDISSNFKKINNNGIIYIAGGDGALNECLNAIYPSNCKIGIIPIGNGNDYARCFYKYFDIQEIIKKTQNPEFKKVDIMKVNNSYCLNISSFGLETKVLIESFKFKEKHPKNVNLSFFYGAFKSIFKNFNMESKIYVDDDFLGNFNITSIIAGNGSSIGGGFKALINSNSSDGVGDFLIAKNSGALKNIIMYIKVFLGKQLSDKNIIYGNFNKLKISFESEQFGNIDGELVNYKEIKMEIIKNALEIAL